jgi:PAS domain S-box-containing protein
LKRDNQHSIEYLETTKFGNLIWMKSTISVVKNDAGEIINFIAVSEDITEKKETEKKLKEYQDCLEDLVYKRTRQLEERNTFLKILIETIPNPVFVINTKGILTQINRSFEEFCQLERKEIVGHSVKSIPCLKFLNVLVPSEGNSSGIYKSYSYENTFSRKDGTDIQVMVYHASFGLDGSNPEGITGLIIDISSQKQFVDQTWKALELERELGDIKTNFISTVSHEFRTPLTTIMASSGLIRLNIDKWNNDRIIHHVSKILNSVKFMTKMLDDILLINRGERGKIEFSPSCIDLKQFCEGIVEEFLLQVQLTHKIVFRYSAVSNIYNVDTSLLRYILNNILSNAIKYTLSKGVIHIDVIMKKNLICFKIKDNGIGIEETDMPKLFEPFFRGTNTQSIKGTGLGLSIVKRCIEIHGGFIRINSKINKGTIVNFSIKPAELTGSSLNADSL